MLRRFLALFVAGCLALSGQAHALSPGQKTALLGGGNIPILDKSGLTGAYAAYGFRLLRQAYAGEAVNVRRASDQAQIDIGFTLGNFNQSACFSFLSGTTGFITKWYDESGNGRDAANATAANQPQIFCSVAALDGRPGILFGDTSAFALATATQGASTVFGAGGFSSAATALTVLPTTNGELWKHGSLGISTTGATGRYRTIQSVAGVFVAAQTIGASTHIFSTLYSTAVSSNSASMFIDGSVSALSINTPPSSITAESGTVIIGNTLLTGGTLGWPGYIGELIIANGQGSIGSAPAANAAQQAVMNGQVAYFGAP